MTATTTAVAWYAGTGAAVVRRGRTTVLLADEPAGAARAVWAGSGARSPVTAVLDALASLPGTTLTTLPPFAAVTVADDGAAHVLVRGRFQAVLGTRAGSVVVEAADVSTWHERRVADVTTVVLGTQPRGAAEVLADAAAWPLAEGVVRAAEVALEVVPGAAGESGDDEAPAAELAPAAVPTPPAEPTPPAGPTPTAGPTPAVEPVPAALSVPEVETMLPASGQDDADADAVDDADADADDVPEPREAAPQAPAVAVAGEDAPAPEATQVGPVDVADDGYAHLWGATVMRTVEDAAVRPEDDDEEEAAEAEGSSPPVDASPVAAPAPSAPPPPPVPAPDPSPAGAGLIAGIPRSWAGTVGTVAAPAPTPAAPAAPAASPAVPPSGDGEIDHDGHTVMSSALAHLRTGAAPEPAPAPPAPPLGAGPQVLARSCPDGHANPPSRDACRTCGAPLTQEAGLAVRPVLGRVRVAGGPQLDLDRPLVVGRRPRTPRSSAGEMPRLVTVVSPNQDVSRSHVEVRLEGWHVLVTDLATTNGTVLHRGGQPPQRLHPGEATLVVDGDVVDLGDGATLTFEEIW